MTIKKDEKLLTVHSNHITLAKVEDEKEAEEILQWLKDLINDTYLNRDQIEPNYSKGADLKALDIFKLLPGTNCKRYGELACLAFAVKLAGQETEVSKCAPLFSEEFQEKQRVLFELLKATGHTIAFPWRQSHD